MRKLIFDTHIHPQSFLEDRGELLSSLRAAVLCSASANDFAQIRALCAAYPNALCACGIHPQFSGEYDAQTENELLLCLKDCAALGEIGLDGTFPGEEQQLRVFIRQMEMAKELSLPVLLHCRKRNEELFAVMKRFPGVKAVYHGFTGSPELAERAIRAGMMLGIGTALLFPTVKRLVRSIEMLPMENILLESDAPYMPLKKEGKGTALNILLTAEKIASIKGLSTEEVLLQNIENSRNFFHTEV